MRCLGSGYCCVQSTVLIVDTEGLALRSKPTGVACPHLRREGPTHSCAVHGEWWYPGTPCASHNAGWGDGPCPMGKGIFSGEIPTVADLVRSREPADMSDLEVRRRWGSREEMEECLAAEVERKSIPPLP